MMMKLFGGLRNFLLILAGMALVYGLAVLEVQAGGRPSQMGQTILMVAVLTGGGAAARALNKKWAPNGDKP